MTHSITCYAIAAIARKPLGLLLWLTLIGSQTYVVLLRVNIILTSRPSSASQDNGRRRFHSPLLG